MNRIKKYNEMYNNIENDYMLGSPTYLWLKKVIKEISYKGNEISRNKTLTKRRKDLRLDEYQNLYDYWNFFKNNKKLIY